jgi:ABC-2 type transport system ATP-binding protein
MSTAAIRTEGLTKVYKGGLGEKDVTGLKDLDLEVHAGEVFAFLGPNGAGKTTTIKLLTRLLHPTRGKIHIFGEANTSPRAMIHVGYLPEQPDLYGYLKGREFLDFIARIFGMEASIRKKRISELLDRVGLGKKGDQAVRSYSRGMVQRLGLAQALVNDPKLLILDEPLASLDPVGRKDFRDLILELKNEGKTLFFSSHILSDAEMIADRVCILNQGKKVSVGKLEDMVRSQISSYEVSFSLNSSRHKKIDIDPQDLIIQDQKVMVRLKGPEEVPGLINRIQKWGGDVISVIPHKKTLEDIFMEETGR